MVLSTSPVPQSLLQPANLRRALDSLDHDAYWQRDFFRTLLLSLLFTLAYALFAAAGYAMARTFGDFVAFWPAAGLLGGVMASTPLRTWPLWICGAIGGRFLADAATVVSHSVTASLVFALASVAEALVFAALLKRPLEHSVRLGRPLYLMTALCIVALTASAAGSLIGAGYIVAIDSSGSLSTIWRTRLLGDYLGLVVVGSLVAWLLLPQIRIRLAARRRSEYVLFAAAVAAIAVLVVSATNDSASKLLAVPGVIEVLIAVPPVWAALRFDFPVVAIGLFALAISVNWFTSQSIALAPPQGAVLLTENIGLQLYLVLVVQLVLFITFTVLEGERAGRELRVRRRLEQVLVDLSDRLVRVESDKIDDVIGDALRNIANFADADRCLLFQISGDGKTFTETHGWYGDRAGAARKLMDAAKLDDFPWARATLERDGYFAFSNLEKGAPDEFAPLREALPPSASILYLGLFSDGILSGCLGLDWLEPHNTWERDSRALLYLVGQLFANVMKRINAELRLETYQSKLRSLAREKSLDEQRTRRKVATDVHDGIAQNLAMARITIGKVLAAGEHDRAGLNQARQLIDSALDRTRNVIADLSPATLYELGLVPALRALAERFEPANDTQCAVEECGEPWPLDDELKGELYRAVRELLTNTAKHASAARAVIRIDWLADGVSIAVEDDGVGFDSGSVAPVGTGFPGFGLFSVREGIELLGGRLQVESARGIGTTVKFRVPKPGGKTT